MGVRECLENQSIILMEGALGERLKREYNLTMNRYITMGDFYRTKVEADALKALWNQYIDVARRYGFPFLAATPTRRTNRETLEQTGRTGEVIAGNVALLRSIQQESGIEMYIGGQMGNRGNAYSADGALSELEAYAFHSWTAERFYQAGVDFLYPSLIPSLTEAAGIARAIDPTGLPYLLSFTIQGDGRLLDGTTIHDAIGYIDGITRNKPVFYMTNCVHPRFVYAALTQPFNQTEQVHKRFAGIQANAAPLTYAELDASPVLLTSSPEELAAEMLKLTQLKQIRLWGGCCGTDNHHLDSIAKALWKSCQASSAMI